MKTLAHFALSHQRNRIFPRRLRRIAAADRRALCDAQRRSCRRRAGGTDMWSASDARFHQRPQLPKRMGTRRTDARERHVRRHDLLRRAFRSLNRLHVNAVRSFRIALFL
jgi:hypothetical protein